MNENPCLNKEIHVLFEHGFDLKNTYNEPCIICMTLYTESVADQTDHFANAFVHENITYGYDIVTTLTHSKVYSRRENQCNKMDILMI